MGKAKSALKSQLEALKIAKNVAYKIAEICRNLNLNLKGVYLVGSRARGDYLVDSDIDIIAVVDGVDKLNTIERLELFKKAIRAKVELRIYSFREWVSNNSEWVKQLKREAKPIKLNNTP